MLHIFQHSLVSWDGGNPLSYPVRFKGQKRPPFLSTSAASSVGVGGNSKSFVDEDVDVFDRGGGGGFFKE